VTLEGRIKRLERERGHPAHLGPDPGNGGVVGQLVDRRGSGEIPGQGRGLRISGTLPDHGTDSHDTSLEQVGPLIIRGLDAPLDAKG